MTFWLLLLLLLCVGVTDDDDDDAVVVVVTVCRWRQSSKQWSSMRFRCTNGPRSTDNSPLPFIKALLRTVMCERGARSTYCSEVHVSRKYDTIEVIAAALVVVMVDAEELEENISSLSCSSPCTTTP